MECKQQIQQKILYTTQKSKYNLHYNSFPLLLSRLQKSHAINCFWLNFEAFHSNDSNLIAAINGITILEPLEP